MKKGIIFNPEFKIIFLVFIIIILAGLFAFFSRDTGKFSEFNFHSSSLTINGENIHEELQFKPDKDYHTLYRNFANPIYSKLTSLNETNTIKIIDVGCSAGTPYVRDFNGFCSTETCLPYTENNEYGCTFGENLGFKKGEEYTINSEYSLNPENLFNIKGNYYIKFVIYSSDNHIKLNKNNFFITGEAITKEKYSERENVIIYVPYYGDISNYNVLGQNDFEFDKNFNFIFVVLSIIPGLFFFFIWYIFGKENSYEYVPKELSTFPTKRKFWEVSAYFNSPLLFIDKNFFSSILLNFYNSKVIDIKEKDKEIFIKLNNFKGDNTEKKVYDLLLEGEKNAKQYKNSPGFFFGEYFNLRKSFEFAGVEFYKKYVEINNEIKKEGEKYLQSNFLAIFLSSFFILGFISLISLFFFFFQIVPIYFLTFILILIFTLIRSPLLIKYKDEYYTEYQKWKAFRNYLKNSFSIKTATHKTVIIWQEYLIYATALGVPDKVIEELKANNLIDSKQENFYSGITAGSYFAFNSTGGSSGFSSGGGGFSGAGGGGIGGGGGGGR